MNIPILGPACKKELQVKVPLVLIPGLLSNELVWQHQRDHLSDIANVQVISATQDTPQKMVQAILDQAPPEFSLAGHSMGGWLCLEIMRIAPSRVKRLCLLNTTMRMDSDEKKKRRQKMILQAQKGQFHEVVKCLVESFVFNPVVKSQVEKMFFEMGNECFIHQQQAMMAREDCPINITCPTLIIHAMKDQVFSFEEHEELVDQIPEAKLAIIEDSGHMSPIEMPQAVSALLRFWLTYF